MQISEVKQQPLPFGALAVAAFKIWLNLFVPYLKLAGIFFIYSLACVVLFLQLLGSSAAGALFFAVFSSFFLTFAFQFLFLSFVPLSESIVNGEKLFVFNAFEAIGLRGILKIIGVSILLVFINLILRLPTFLTDNPIVMLPYMLLMAIVWTVVIIYVIFIPQAIILRGAGVVDSLKYSYYLVKDRWFKTFGVVLFSGLFQAIIGGIILAAMAGLYFAIYGAELKDLIAAAVSHNTMMAFMLGLGLIKSFIAFFVIFIILSGFCSVYPVAILTALFINLESDEPSSSKNYEDFDSPSPLDTLIKDDIPSKEDHVFTEIFKNVREINISTKQEEDSASAIAPKNREEVLRHFEPLEIAEAPEPTPEQTMQNLVARIDDYPTAPIAGFQQRQGPAVKKDGDPKKMPTLDITMHDRATNHGLPSVVKPKSEEN